MNRRFVAVMASCVLALAPVAAADSKPAKESAGSDVFGLTKVWKLHLEIPAKDYETMQPSGGMRGPGGPPGGPRGPGQPERPPARAADPTADVHHGSGFGMDFP